MGGRSCSCCCHMSHARVAAPGLALVQAQGTVGTSQVKWLEGDQGCVSPPLPSYHPSSCLLGPQGPGFWDRPLSLAMLPSFW